MIDEEYWKAWSELDDLAAEVGGYVTQPKKGDPKYRMRALIDKCEELGRPLTEKEAEEFLIGYY